MIPKNDHRRPLITAYSPLGLYSMSELKKDGTLESVLQKRSIEVVSLHPIALPILVHRC